MKTWLLLPNLSNEDMRSNIRFVTSSACLPLRGPRYSRQGVEKRQNNWLRQSLLLLFTFFTFPSFSQLKVAMKHVEKLTSPEMHGRGYVNGGDSIAAEYIAKQYELLGLKKVGKSYFQQFSFPVNTFPDSMRVNVNGKNLIPGVDFLVDPETASSDFFYYNLIKCTLDSLEKKVEDYGRISDGTDTQMIAFAVDLTSSDKEELKEFEKYIHSGRFHYPLIKLVNTKFTWSVSTIQGNFCVEIQKEKMDTAINSFYVHIRNKFIENHKTRNVIGCIKGKNKKAKAIVFTAHYDHLGRMGSDTYFPGCNDNASGIAMLLNLAKYYTENKPDQDIYFIAFAAEEAGLLGSQYYVSHPLFPLEKIRFLVNMDIMGTGGEGITVVNATKHEKEFDLLKKINEENDYLVAVKPRGEAANSDHYWFSQKGVPAFFIYTMGGSQAYHDVNDKFGSPDFSKFEDITKMLTEFVKRLN